MSNPWTFSGEPATRLQGGSVVLVEGASFSISSSSGDIEPGGLDGLFFQDTRFISAWRIRLDGEPPQPLAVMPRHPFAATFIARRAPNPGLADSTLLLQRTRYVGNGMRADVSVRNLSQESTACTLTFELHADFAHVFEVKESRVKERGLHHVEVEGSMMSFTYELLDVRRGLSVRFPDEALVIAGVARLDVVIPPAGEWRANFDFLLSVDGEKIDCRYGGDDPEKQSAPVTRQRAWERRAPRVRCNDKGVEAVFLQSERDLGALRIADPSHPDRFVIAAGAPWFMTLFGRDSLITSLMTLDIDPSIASATLLTLARTQGSQG